MAISLCRAETEAIQFRSTDRRVRSGTVAFSALLVFFFLIYASPGHTSDQSGDLGIAKAGAAFAMAALGCCGPLYGRGSCAWAAGSASRCSPCSGGWSRRWVGHSARRHTPGARRDLEVLRHLLPGLQRGRRAAPRAHGAGGVCAGVGDRAGRALVVCARRAPGRRHARLLDRHVRRSERPRLLPGGPRGGGAGRARARAVARASGGLDRGDRPHAGGNPVHAVARRLDHHRRRAGALRCAPSSARARRSP